MRNVICVLTMFGCITAVQAEDGLGTNTDRQRTIQTARVVKQSRLPPKLNVSTNAVVLGTNALRLIPSPDSKESQFGSYYKALLGAVERRWTDFLEQWDSAHQKAGTVVLQFKLHQD